MLDAASSTAICNVGCGLYALRYVAGVEDAISPTAEVRPGAGYESIVSIVSAPGVQPGALDRPGAVLVIVSTAPAAVEIVVHQAGIHRHPQAQFSLELLAAGLPARSRAQAPLVTEPAVPALPPAGGPSAGRHAASAAARPERDARLLISAHVARLGDVEVREGDWIAGPSTPAPVEAITVKSLSPDFSVVAEYVNTQRPGHWIACPTADFVGTRQQASPLLGLKLRLQGPRAVDYKLHAEAMFLGAPIVSEQGQDILLSSASGLDPLVGLRLSLSNVTRLPIGPVGERSVGSRVRVFRGNQ